jgi:heme exporter protein D
MTFQFADFAEFIAMGGHGFYVWVAYGVALLVFTFNVLVPTFKRRRFVIEHARELRREALNASDS